MGAVLILARKREDNLIPQAHKITVEEASKGGKASGKVRARKKTIADYLKKWADLEVDDRQKATLRALGLDEEATNRTLLIIPLIKNASKGDVKSLQMIIELLGEDKKKEAEIKKLQAEIRKLREETAQLKQGGSGRDIEDLTPLAEMLNDSDTDD